MPSLLRSRSVKGDTELLATAARLAAQGRRFALVSIVRTAGSTPRKPGAKMIVCEDGEQHGTVGGGAIEHALVREALDAITAGAPRLVRKHLTHELAMCCGGEVEAFVDPMGGREYVVLVGGGHINQALAPMLDALGFDVLVVDEFEEFASPERFPGVARFAYSFSPDAWDVPLGRETSIVIATRDHAVDQNVLEALAAKNARPRYLGVIGSRGKLGRFRKRLEAKGIAPDWIAQVRGPIGLAIGAETPAEIAVSVAAELVAVRRGAEDAAAPAR